MYLATSVADPVAVLSPGRPWTISKVDADKVVLRLKGRAACCLDCRRDSHGNEPLAVPPIPSCSSPRTGQTGRSWGPCGADNKGQTKTFQYNLILVSKPLGSRNYLAPHYSTTSIGKRWRARRSWFRDRMGESPHALPVFFVTPRDSSTRSAATESPLASAMAFWSLRALSR